MTLLHLAVLAALGATGTAPAGARPLPASIPWRLYTHEADSTPGIRVWVTGGDLFHRGDRVSVYYRTERDAYVTIFRVDTDGRIQVLFPRTPDDENLGYGGATYAVSSFDRGDAFYVDDDPGIGYIFGVASADPFDYDAILRGGRWDVSTVAGGRLHGDPRAALEELSAQLMAQGYTAWDTHLVPYYVDQHFDYPRFMCYECHAYQPYSAWDPYSAWCPRFQLVLYNDPYYFYPSYWYPTRYYGGNRVVFRAASPRFVFSARAATAPGIAYRDRSGYEAPARVPERGARAVDVGGVGSVPAPRGLGRRTVPSLVGGDQPRGDEGRIDRREGFTPDRREPMPPPGQPTGRHESPGIEIVPRPSDAGQSDRRVVDKSARQAPVMPEGKQPGFGPGQARSGERPAPGDAWYGRRQAEDARPARPAQPQAREAPQGQGAAPARGESPRAETQPRSAPPPSAREAPRQAPRQEPQRGSNPQLQRRRP